MLHDIGFMVNCVAFPKEFAKAAAYAAQKNRLPLTRRNWLPWDSPHCETGRALAEKWHSAPIRFKVIAHHTIRPEQGESAQPLIALVHLSDLLCRVRGMGYGYYEGHKVDSSGRPGVGPFSCRNIAILPKMDLGAVFL